MYPVDQIIHIIQFVYNTGFYIKVESDSSKKIWMCRSRVCLDKQWVIQFVSKDPNIITKRQNDL